MFKKIFQTKKTSEPLNYDLRKYFEYHILWLQETFPEPEIGERKIFIPTESDFPIKWNGSKKSVFEVVKIVAENMQINPNEIEVDFYDEGLTEIGGGTSTIFLENDTESNLTAGLYHGKNENGKYEVSVNVAYLNNPESIIATVAHELCHIKLLGENKIEENDEYLTDLATVFWGFGIFTANTSFQFYQQNDRWGHNSSGYLKQEDWGYSLALFAFLRYEDEPEWSKYLNSTVKKDFEKSLAYMIENESEIFKFEEDES